MRLPISWGQRATREAGHWTVSPEGALCQTRVEEVMRMPRSSMSAGLGATVLLLSSWVSMGETRESPPPERFTSEVASVWFDTLYDLVNTEQITPPVASRIYGIVAVALYEAIVPGSVQQRSLVGQLNELVAVPQPLPHLSYHSRTVGHSPLARTVTV